MLYASWLFQRIVPPVLAFSLGSLGFLTGFDFNSYSETLSRVFADGFNVTLRLRFEATIMRSKRRPLRQRRKWDEIRAEKGIACCEFLQKVEEQPDIVEELMGEEGGLEGETTHYPECTYHILNEVVVDRGPNPSMPHENPSYSLQIAL